MSRWGKSIKSMKIVLILVIMIVIGNDLFLIAKINLTESKVAKSYFSNNYFIEASNEEMKIENFKEYMLMEGWSFSENYYGTIIFRKGNLQKEIPVYRLIKI
ncbi:hypothetical protein [Clostridium gasigenes]|uniref:hypothetical protein n=1 Tax=Clostridium gasigenes TaxID=94869 RepID=UPI001438526B|nr:hypothetical protein [Clostridium gasigenes]MBU3102521.1 hypothetical protein [Clostridium gasigenes]MBU3131139.1 hypothetical protein [Clostridium gasigenes]NKF08606.1 hypothetical protein [Clostridium gasigenes]QSW18394.1 hypothetical protein J1C67_12630 [Clostridium gasigenes]